jgi:hypothetical protein
MADPLDLLRQLRSAASPVTGPVSDVLEGVLGRQLELERHLLAPLNVMIDSLEKTSAAMRTQADAFNAAAAAFKQSAQLLDAQAATIEQATQALRDPAKFMRSAGGLVKRDD